MKKEKFVVAVKDTATGEILPGKKLASYRKLEFADRDWHKLARREGVPSWRVGIFLNGKLMN
jgi:hypothetical protein